MSDPTSVPTTKISWRVTALLLATFFTMVAAMGQITILGKQVFDMTGRELDLGLLGLAQFLPTALLSPVAGVVADRFDRRFVYAAGLAGEICASLGLFWYISRDPTSLAPIFALVMAFGVARAFVGPASRALPVDLAPEGAVERMVALNTLAFQAGLIAGPVLFGFAFVADIAIPYALAAAASGSAMVLLALVPRSNVARSRAAPGVRAAVTNALDGLRFIRRNRILFGAISLDLFAVLFGGAVALLPAIAEKRLGVGAVGLGALRAAVGIGAGLAATVLAVRPLRRHIGRVLMVVVAVYGLGTIVLGLTRSYALAFAAMLVLSAADAVSMFIRSTLVPLATHTHMRGRVLAVEHVFIGASSDLGAFESGVAGYLLGIVGAVVTGGIGTLIVVGLWWRLFPELVAIDRFNDARPPPEPIGGVASPVKPGPRSPPGR